MNIWDKLLHLKIDNKQRFQILFAKLVNDIKKEKFSLILGEVEKNDHFLVVEENRAGSYFVHLVPKQAYDLFKEMQIKAPNQFLGFSVLAGKYNERDVRASCFGVDCGRLGKSLIK